MLSVFKLVYAYYTDKNQWQPKIDKLPLTFRQISLNVVIASSLRKHSSLVKKGCKLRCGSKNNFGESMVSNESDLKLLILFA